MLLANEAVGGLLARARRPALYRVHEHPQHEALLALADRLTALGLPVVAASRARGRPAGLARRGAAGRAARADPAGAAGDPRGLRHAAAAHAPGRALRPGQQRATPRWPRLPTCTSRRRSGAIPTSSCTARPARSPDSARTAPKARDLPELALRCSQREREAADAERRADAICLAFLLRDRLRRDGWHAAVRGRRHGAHRRRAVRALRRCLRGLPARRGASIPASASTATSTASRSSDAPRAAASASATSSRASSRRSTRRAGGRRSTSCPRTRPRARASRAGQAHDAAPPAQARRSAGAASAGASSDVLDSVRGRRRTHDREQPQGAARVPHPRAPRDRHRAHGHRGQVAARRQGRAARGLRAGARGRAVARRRDDRALRAGQPRQPRARRATASCWRTSARSRSSPRASPRRA